MGRRHVGIFGAVCLGNSFLIGPGENKMICDKLLDYNQLAMANRLEVLIKLPRID